MCVNRLNVGQINHPHTSISWSSSPIYLHEKLNHNNPIINVGHMIRSSCYRNMIIIIFTYSSHTHNKITTNVGQMIKLSCSQNTIIVIFNLFIMIHDHNKITINIGQMIKLYWLKQNENCESIILNHRWTDIELILNKTYEHDNLIMINLSPMLVER
jgi:hypothetical protein